MLFLLSCSFIVNAGDVSSAVSNTDNGKPDNCPTSPGAGRNTPGGPVPGGGLGAMGPSNPTANAYRGNPINIATGNKFHVENVYTGEGEFPLEYNLYYNSRNKDSDGTLHGRWTTSYSQQIEFYKDMFTLNKSNFFSSNDNYFIMHREDGQKLYFEAFANGGSVGFSSDNTVKIQGPLELIGPNGVTATRTNYLGFKYQRPDGLTEIYEKSGQLKEIIAPNGQKHVIARSTACRDVQANTCVRWNANGSCDNEYDWKPVTYSCLQKIGNVNGTKECNEWGHSNTICTTSGLQGLSCSWTNYEWRYVAPQQCSNDYSLNYSVSDSYGNTIQLSRNDSAPSPASVVNKYCEDCPSSIVVNDDLTINVDLDDANQLIEGIEYLQDDTATAGVNERAYKTFLYELNDASFNGGCSSSWECETQLTGVLDEENWRTHTFEYENNATWPGRATKSYHGVAAEIVDYTKVTYNHERVVENDQGRAQIFHFGKHDGGIRLNRVDANGGTNCSSSAVTYTYGDDVDHLISKIDYGNGRNLSYTYYNDDRIETITEAKKTAGDSLTHAVKKAKYYWLDADSELVEKIEFAENGNNYKKYEFDYEGNGRLNLFTITDLTNYFLPYATNNQTRVWDYDYEYWDTDQSQLKTMTINGPLPEEDGIDDITALSYSSSGYLESVTNALDQEFVFSDFTSLGKAKTITYPNGEEINLTYNPLGWVESIKDSSGTYALDYYKNGLLKRITFPTSGYLNYQYTSAMRLKSVTDSDGNSVRITSTLNSTDATLRDVLTEIRNASAEVRYSSTEQFDSLFRLYKSLGPLDEVTEYNYGSNGEISAAKVGVEEVGSPKQSYSYGTDALNRITRIDHPDNHSSHYNYDAEGRIVSVTDQNSLETTYQYDGLGNLMRLISPDTGTTDYTYDAAGNVRTIKGARGITKTYSYDKLSRVESETYAAPADPSLNKYFFYDEVKSLNNVSGSFDGTGYLTKVQDASGSTDFYRDPQGRVRYRVNVIGSTTYRWGFDYNSFGEITKITYPSTRTVTYSRDDLSALTGVTTYLSLDGSTTILSDVVHEPFGPIKSFTYGNGVTQSNDYDDLYRVDGYSLLKGTTSILSKDLTRFSTGNIQGIDDLVSGGDDQTFKYDAVGRLDISNGAYGKLDYDYDGVGNRTQFDLNDGEQTLSYNYVPSGQTTPLNRLQSISQTSPSGPTWNFGYNQEGNLLSDQRKSGTSFTYDSTGRLETATASGAMAAYIYNAFGQRSIKLLQIGSNSKHSHMHYDLFGRLIAETTEAGMVLREYVYAGGKIVAVLTPSNLTIDSDFDGLSDYWENLYFGTLDRDGSGDFDMDGLLDRDELRFGYNPISNDSDTDYDGDLLPDLWEITHFDSLDQDGNGDFDKDGISNYKEWLKGSSPTKKDLNWFVPVIGILLL